LYVNLFQNKLNVLLLSLDNFSWRLLTRKSDND